MRALLLLPLAGCFPFAPRHPTGPIAAERAKESVHIVARADPTSPNVYLQAIVAAGSAHDPVGAEGLAHLTARALADAGAGARSSREVREALYPTGNAFEVGVERDWVTLRLRCHVDHATLCIELFADALLAPRFDLGDVRRLRDEAVYTVTDGLLADDEALGMEAFEALIYEGHPYGHPPAGRAGTLELLEPDDLQAFHAGHYVREAITVGVAGGYDDAHTALLAERLLAAPPTPAPELALQRPIPVAGRSLMAVRSASDSTGFHIGHPLPLSRSHPDWVALQVAMTAFGAHRQSFGRLYQRIRGQRGMNYGDYAYIEHYDQRGWAPLPEQGVLRRQPYFYMWLRPTTVDNGPFAVKMAIDELELLVDEGLTQEEFDQVRSYLQSGVPLLAQDPGRRLAYALDAVATGTPDYLELVPAGVEDLALEDVNAALKTHLRPADLRIVAVTGDPAALVRRLVGEEDTPIVYEDVEVDGGQAARDAEVAAKTLELAEEDAWIVDGDGLFR